MKTANQPHEFMIEMLKKHNDELQQMCKRQAEALLEQQTQIEGYVQALKDRMADIRKIVDIAILSGDNPDLIHKKIKKWITAYSDLSYSNLTYNTVQQLADMCCKNIISYLREKYPELKNDELTICAYICLDFSSDQIQYLADYKHINSLYNKRHRIKCKLGAQLFLELDAILKEMIND